MAKWTLFLDDERFPVDPDESGPEAAAADDTIRLLGQKESGRGSNRVILIEPGVLVPRIVSDMQLAPIPELEQCLLATDGILDVSNRVFH